MPSSLTALQAAAILLLCRLSAFFCCDVPYTAAHAAALSAAALLEMLVSLPLVLMKGHREPPAFLRIFCKIYVAIYAAYLLPHLLRMLTDLQMPYPPAAMLLLLAAAGFGLPRTPAAAPRTAVILLFPAALGFLLLPVSGAATAHLLSLAQPADFKSAFLHEIRNTGAFALFPLMIAREKKSPHDPLRTWLIWGLGEALLLPLIVLFGAMQNGRLTAWEGNPFFLLLQRTPLSDAVRTDGFWMLLAVACGLLTLIWLMQNARPQRSARAAWLLLPLTALALLMFYTGYDGTGLGLGALLPCIAALPCAIIPRKRRNAHAAA